MIYAPTCPACRAHDPKTFYARCDGCQVRRAHIEAAKGEPPVTPQQVAGADSTMQQLK